VIGTKCESNANEPPSLSLDKETHSWGIAYVDNSDFNEMEEVYLLDISPVRSVASLEC